ncbi:MAG: cobalamin biosynthesis protein CbiX [Comamonadaceae bacterium]|nr:cobalamin biosynthesis protein CbiX [Comamonadaceae bacterium]
MLGVIVFAHGSRDPQWRLPVEAVAQQITQSDSSVAVSCAYLELCEPDLPSACAELVDKGASRIHVLPLFFGMGKHAREDLPALMRTMAKRYPDVHFEQLATAGEDPRMTALLARIALEQSQ